MNALADATGCAVASFDYPGFGDNAGWPHATPTPGGCVASGAAVVAWLARRLGDGGADDGGADDGDAADGDADDRGGGRGGAGGSAGGSGVRIALWGHSLGSAVAVALSAGLAQGERGERGERGSGGQYDSDGDGFTTDDEWIAATVAPEITRRLAHGALAALVLEVAIGHRRSSPVIIGHSRLSSGIIVVTPHSDTHRHTW